jgi:hypothetical protein
MDLYVHKNLVNPEQLQPFECRFAVVWEDPGSVASVPLSWDRVKSLYR